jgi:hypothetical protein
MVFVGLLLYFKVPKALLGIMMGACLAKPKGLTSKC